MAKDDTGHEIMLALGQAFRDTVQRRGGVTVTEAIIGLAQVRESLLRSFALSFNCELGALRRMLDTADIGARRLADQNTEKGDYKIYDPTERIGEHGSH